MAKQRCANGHSWESRGLRPAPIELRCPHRDCALPAEPKLKQDGGFRADNESSLRRSARDRFNAAVRAHGCFYSAYRSPDGKPRREGHDVCVFPLDAHHLVEKQWIETNYADLDEADLLAILFDPRLGSPLCRLGHEGVKQLLIYWDEVSEDAKEAAREHDVRWLDVPTAAGVPRKSLFAELRRVCPDRNPTERTPR